MEDIDRRKILSNIPELCQKIDYNRFKAQCIGRGLVTNVMIREIEKHEQENEETKMRRLLTKLTKRGPEAYQHLKDICLHHFMDALKLLEPTLCNLGDYHDAGGSLTQANPRLLPPKLLAINGHSDKESKNLELRPFEEGVAPDKTLLRNEFTLSTSEHRHSKIGHYPMRSKHRGVLFFANIINFKPNKGTDTRNGADMDKNNLIWVFRQMGFVVFYYEDINFAQLNALLDQLIESDYLRRTDCFVFSLMTHGSHMDGKEYVQFTDGGHTNIQNIISKFYNDTCVRLRGKPKIFILPFCRGNKPDTGVMITQKRVETDGMEMNVKADRNLSTKADILICYGTVQGFETHRDVKEGSWFVQELCKVFAQHAHDTDVEVMMKMVMGRLMNEYRTENMQLQTPSIESWGFRSALFFNPGYYLGG